MDGIKPLTEESFKKWVTGTNIRPYCGRCDYDLFHDSKNVWCRGSSCDTITHQQFLNRLRAVREGFYYYTGELVKDPVYKLVDKVDGRLRYYTLVEIK